MGVEERSGYGGEGVRREGVGVEGRSGCGREGVRVEGKQ